MADEAGFIARSAEKALKFAVVALVADGALAGRYGFMNGCHSCNGSHLFMARKAEVRRVSAQLGGPDQTMGEMTYVTVIFFDRIVDHSGL